MKSKYRTHCLFIALLCLLCAPSLMAAVGPLDTANLSKRPRTLYVATADVDVYDNAAGEKGLISGSGVGTTNISAGWPKAGTIIDIDASGVIRGGINHATNKWIISLRVGKYEIAYTDWVAIPNMTTTNYFNLKASLCYRTVGASGTVVGNGMLMFPNGIGGASGNTNALCYPIARWTRSPEVTIGTLTNSYLSLSVSNSVAAVTWGGGTNQIVVQSLRISSTQ